MRTTNILLGAMILTLTQGAFAKEAAQNPQAAAQPPQASVPQHSSFSRRSRLIQIGGWLSEGVLGESNEGLLVLRGKALAGAEKAMKEENEEREKTFKALSVKTATTVASQKKLYAKKRRQESPVGSPLQNIDGSWTIKT